MNRITENKLILIKRKSRLEELIRRFNTADQARFYIEHMGADFSDYQQEDRTYKAAISEAARQMEALGKLQVVDREHVPNFIFGPQDVVVAIGQDGLVANTLKYLSFQPLIGVNPDPRRWDGVLLPFNVNDLTAVITEVFAGRRKTRNVTLARASLNDGQTLYAVNDLFIGQKTHVSARYIIAANGRQEQQSSSGIIVSTGLGSTGWLKSVIAGASAITGNAFGVKSPKKDMRFAWDNDALYYSVREPFASRTTSAELVFGKVTPDDPLVITSMMPENGVVFSDGIESDYLQFNSGMEATVTLAERKGRLVV